MEPSQGNAHFFSFIKLENRKVEQYCRQEGGGWYQWEGKGGRKRMWEGKYGANTVYTCM
jgi:hypothetical protein